MNGPLSRSLPILLLVLASASASAQLASPSSSAGSVVPGQASPTAVAPVPAAPANVQGAPPQAGGSRAPDTYVLGPGDRVRLSVYDEPRLSGDYVINSNGELSFPLIGNVRATGLSIANLQAALAAKLAAGYLKDPKVTAEVMIFRPFYVLGEVARPGQYPYVDGLTIQQAIATAGGYTYRAKRSKVFLRGPQAAEERQVDLKKEPLKAVAPGDTIRIGERFF